MKELKSIWEKLWGNKTSRLLIIIGGGALFLFFFGSMAYSWIFIVFIAIVIVGYFIASMKKDLEQGNKSKLELINRLNGENALYLEAASLIDGNEEKVGALAITDSRVCFASKIGDNEPLIIDILFVNIKSFGESNFVRLETENGSYGFKVNNVNFVKELIATKTGISFTPNKSVVKSAKEIVNQVADVMKTEPILDEENQTVDKNTVSENVVETSNITVENNEPPVEEQQENENE